MTITWVSTIILTYFALLYLVARFGSRKADSATFFVANRNAPWPLVAYGMIGVAISGITFISVPGQVAATQFSYFQLVIGYSAGLLAVAFVLLPVFYRIKAVSIYTFLQDRFGSITHRTGTFFFLFAQTATAAFKLYLMAHVLQLLIFDALGLPFALTVLATLLLIWLYTYRGGIQTVILTDTLQTTFLLLAVGAGLWSVSQQLGLSVPQLYQGMQQQGLSQIFFWDWDSPQNFFKLLLTGALLTIMTNGLDQSVMQKHLTCRSLGDSQKNIVALAAILLVVNLLFLFLGGSLHLFAAEQAVALPEKTDSIYPVLALEHLGLFAGTAFLVGIAAAAYSSADSSLTGLTTAFCVDILKFDTEKADRPKLRQLVHLAFTLLIYLVILLFNQLNDDSVLSAFIRASGFIYGPLVGLFAFGMFSRRRVPDRWAALLAVSAPLLAGILDRNGQRWFGYTFGYDILLLNSLLAFFGLWAISKRLNR